MAPLENNGLEFYIGAALSEPRSQLYIKSWHVNKPLAYGNCQCKSAIESDDVPATDCLNGPNWPITVGVPRIHELFGCQEHFDMGI